MRPFTTILLLAALALSVYNALEVRGLKAEIATLRTGASAAGEGPEAAQARAHALLREAELHSAKANALMKKGDLDGALREMQQSADLIAQASKGGADSDTIARIRTRLTEMLERGKEKLRPAGR